MATDIAIDLPATAEPDHKSIIANNFYWVDFARVASRADLVEIDEALHQL